MIMMMPAITVNRAMNLTGLLLVVMSAIPFRNQLSETGSTRSVNSSGSPKHNRPCTTYDIRWDRGPELMGSLGSNPAPPQGDPTRSAARDGQLGLGDHSSGRLVELLRVEPSVRQGNPARRAGASPLALCRLTGPRRIQVEPGDEIVECREGVNQSKSVTNVVAGRESLEVPRDVFADVTTRLHLAAVELGEVLSVSTV